MPLSQGIKNALIPAVVARCEAMMTALSHTTENVFYRRAPSTKEGEAYVIVAVPDDIEDFDFSDRNGTANDVLVTAACWSPNARTAGLMGDDLVPRMTAISAGLPTLAPTGYTLLDIARVSRTELDDQRAGTTDYFGDMTTYSVRMRLTSSIGN